jgi:hypothetical protein
MNDPDYLALNQQVSAWPGWMWEVFGEVLIEVGINIVQRQLGLTIGDDVKDAIRDCGSLDLIGCIGNTVDVLRRFFPALRFIDLTLGLIENTTKTTKVWTAIEKLETFGQSFTEKFINVLKSRGSILDKIKWSDRPHFGASLIDGDQESFLTSLITGLGGIFNFTTNTYGRFWHTDISNPLYPYLNYVHAYYNANTLQGYPNCPPATTLTIEIVPRTGGTFKLRFCDP